MKKEKKNNIFCNFEYISLILFDINNLTNPFCTLNELRK